MQRLSLSSPSVKLHRHSYGGAQEDTDTFEEPKLTDSVSSVSMSDEDDDTAGKSRRASSPPFRTENFIHLLPFLMFFCFLVLYLCSHTPSAAEMASFRGSKHSDLVVDLNDFRRLPAERADILPIRTVKNLQQIRPHRKFADS